MLKPILPITPFDDTSQNWKCENMYGRCVVIVTNVVFTEDFGQLTHDLPDFAFKKGDAFAVVQIDLNNGRVTAWRTADQQSPPISCPVRLVFRADDC